MWITFLWLLLYKCLNLYISLVARNKNSRPCDYSCVPTGGSCWATAGSSYALTGSTRGLRFPCILASICYFQVLDGYNHSRRCSTCIFLMTNDTALFSLASSLCVYCWRGKWHRPLTLLCLLLLLAFGSWPHCSTVSFNCANFFQRCLECEVEKKAVIEVGSCYSHEGGCSYTPCALSLAVLYSY